MWMVFLQLVTLGLTHVSATSSPDSSAIRVRLGRAWTKEEPGSIRHLQGTCQANKKKHQIMSKSPGKKPQENEVQRTLGFCPSPITPSHCGNDT